MANISKTEKVQRWRNRTKARIIKAMGGKCVICGYYKCDAAMDLHHINPDEKEFGFGKMMANPKSWEKIVIELRKCVLLCSRCHREIHYGVTVLPKQYTIFNEKYADYKRIDKLSKQTYCPICGNKKNDWNTTCSRSCAAKKSYSVKWNEINLELQKHNNNKSLVARELNISTAAVRKRCIKLGIQ